MQPPSKMVELAGQLLDSARAGKIKWSQGVGSNSYSANLPDVSLVITRRDIRPPRTYFLELVNNEGEMIESLSPYTSEEEHNVLTEIHDLARRYVLDIDGNIDKALDYLRNA